MNWLNPTKMPPQTKTHNNNQKVCPTKNSFDVVDDDEDSVDGFVGPDEEGQVSSTDHVSEYEEKERIEIGSKETSRVWYTRALVIAVLIAVATTVSILVFKYSSDVEQNDFELDFKDNANLIASKFTGGAERRISAIENLANEITSYVQSQSDVSWPNVALPNFERRASYALQLSDVLSIIYFPFVTADERKSWETYSVENQGWLKEGLAVQGIPQEDWDQKSIDILEKTWGAKNENMSIPEEIFRVSGIGMEEENGPGPFAPWWQFAPVFPVPTLVNYNGFSHPTRDAPLSSTIENKKILVTRAWDYADESDPDTVGKKAALNLFLQHGGNDGSYEAGPASDLYVPVFDDFGGDANVVGVLAAYVYWEVYFEDALSDRNVGIYVILENTCGQTFTYRVDGSEATYLGQGDLHDDDYTYLGVSTEYSSSFTIFEGDEENLPEGQCLYRLRMYPSKELHEQFLSDGPRNFTLALAGTFAFTCIVFLIYDYLVEKRQQLVLKTAVQTGAVVASLFPAEVRKRLYEKEEEKAKERSASKNDRMTPFKSLTRAASGESIEQDSMAIADLYPACTVLFCDIVGFTKWSSSREPKDVFKLLETMYKAFDKSAHRLGVFKVETIGDCYVAVTGLPHPQPNHAVIMAKFATSCTMKVRKVTERLVDQLGIDTRDLMVRVGMHSGPVTAGVLRGAKARFQLFGDTVNTAARMESTGAPMKVQLSTTTAALLEEAGHMEWLRPREEEVDAKGKGKMQTYWLETKIIDHSSTDSHCAHSVGTSSEGENRHELTTDAMERPH